MASIAGQLACPLPILVIVVDDASPIPAKDELAAVAFPAHISIAVIEQVNGGLDSDDEWSSDHLARAVAARDQGYDVTLRTISSLVRP